MTDPQTGQPAVSRLLDQQEAMQAMVAALQVGQARIETKLDTMCEQRKDQHEEHVACLAHREMNFSENDDEHARLWASINELTTQWKAIRIFAAIIIGALTIISILLAIGEKLI